jgi:hypothetical protein
MSLQIRRGIESQRTGVVFDEGEISWTTDTKKLYVGDGTTAGGVNVVASAAGTGLTWNNTTQTLNFSGSGLGLTTDVVSEGYTSGRIYFTNARAQTAVSSMFTTLGTSPVTGTVTSAISPSQITVSGSTSGMNPYIPFTVTGSGGQGLTAGTYYICTIVDATHVTLSSTLLLAQAGTAIASFTTGSITGTTFSAGGGGGDVYFTYNATNQTISANVTLDGIGITSVSGDTSPALGGNLNIGNFNVTSSGSGAISIVGAITASTGNITATSGNFVATNGNITVTNGNITATAGGVYTNNIFGTSANAQLKIGSDTYTTSLGIICDTSVSSIAGLSVRGLTSGSSGIGQFVTAMRIKGQKGTLASPAVLSAADGIGQVVFNGYVNGAGLGATQADLVVIKGTMATTGDLVSTFATANLQFIIANGTNPANAVTASFNANGAFTAPVLQLASYASDAARTTAVPSPTAGMMVFMASGTSPAVTNKAVIYNGSAWALLPG